MPNTVVPGDPAAMRELARRLTTEAGRADATADRLGAVAAGTGRIAMAGDYAPRFRAALLHLSPAARALADAYRFAGNALRLYADELQVAKTRAAAATEVTLAGAEGGPATGAKQAAQAVRAAEAGEDAARRTAAKLSLAADLLPRRATHEQLLARYHVPPDPAGTVLYPFEGYRRRDIERWGHAAEEIAAGEAALLEELPYPEWAAFGLIRLEAQRAADEAFDIQESPEGPSNAFQHAYWSVLLAFTLGSDFAAEITTAHETVPGNNPVTAAMDLHNNEVGLRIVAENPTASPWQLRQLVADAVRRGETVVVGADGRLVPSQVDE
jgi:uncharacterized protein YukE